MKRFVADDVLQGLRHHRPFHRMKMVRYRRRKPTEIVVGRRKKFHVTRGIAQVPGEAIQARIQMAGGAGGLTQTGSFVSVIKMFSTRLDRAGSRIEQRHVCHHRRRLGIHDRDRGGKPVQHVEPLARFIERHTGRPLPQRQPFRAADPVAGRVDHHQVA